jgi:hypothetical protein
MPRESQEIARRLGLRYREVFGTIEEAEKHIDDYEEVLGRIAAEETLLYQERA